MRLSEKLRQAEGRAAGKGQGPAQELTGLQVGSIRGAALSYNQTITALFEGETVTLLGSADLVGMSQCEKFVPHQGDANVPDWAPSVEFDIIAINGVPVGKYAQPEQLAARTRTRQP